MHDELADSTGRYVAAFLRDTELPTTDDGICPYLPNHMARSEGFYVTEPIEASVYRALMDCGFRRSGRVFYRPACQTCTACKPLRIPTATFHPSRSMRRVWQRNDDVRVEISQPEPTDEKHTLYARYLDTQHDNTMSTERAAFDEFLYGAPVPGIEIRYYLGTRLIGVSLVDDVDGVWSSVYMFFDPAEGDRSLGTFSVLWEIDHCRSHGIPYYYLGFYVPDSATMAYKARFRPAEILDATNTWVPLADPEDV